MAGAPLPPGDMGLPVLGETLTALKNGFAFVEAGARRHGPIFKTNLFGRKTAVITGPEASALFIDSSRVERSGAMPPHIETLFAGRSLPLLDGEEHRRSKAFRHGGLHPRGVRLVPADHAEARRRVPRRMVGRRRGAPLRRVQTARDRDDRRDGARALAGTDARRRARRLRHRGRGILESPDPAPRNGVHESQKGAGEDPGSVRELRPGAPGRAQGRWALAHSRGEDPERPRHLDGGREERASPRRRRRAHRVGLVRGSDPAARQAPRGARV